MDYHSMKRRQLQALCKKHNIPANSANSVLADKLSELLNEKQKPKTRQRTCIKSAVEKTDEDEPALSKRQAKKVRFSPDNDLVEYEPGKKHMAMVTNTKGQRKSIAKKVDKSVVGGSNSVELIEDVPVKLTRSRVQGKEAIKDGEKGHDVVEGTGGKLGRVTRSKANTLSEGVVDDNKPRKRAVKDVENANESTDGTVVERVRVTRSKAETKRSGKQVAKDKQTVEQSKEIIDIPFRVTRSRGETLNEDIRNTVNDSSYGKKRTRREMKLTDTSKNLSNVAPEDDQKHPKRKSISIRGVKNMDEDETDKVEVVNENRVTRLKSHLAKEPSGRNIKRKTENKVEEPLKHASKKNITRRKSVVQVVKIESVPRLEEPVKRRTRQSVVMEESKVQSDDVKKNVTRSRKNASENERETVSNASGSRKSMKQRGTIVIEDQTVEAEFVSPVDETRRRFTRSAIRSERKEPSESAIKEQYQLSPHEVAKIRAHPVSSTAPVRITRSGIKVGRNSASSFAERLDKKKQASQSAQISSPKVAEVRPKPNVIVARSEISPKPDRTVEPQSDGVIEHVTRSRKNTPENKRKAVSNASGSLRSRKRRGTVVIEDQTVEAEFISPVDESPKVSVHSVEGNMLSGKQMESSLRTPATRRNAVTRDNSSNKRSKLSRTKQRNLVDHTVKSSKDGYPVSEIGNFELGEKVDESRRRFTRSAIRSERQEPSELRIKEQYQLSPHEVSKIRADPVFSTAPVRITRSGIKAGRNSASTFAERIDNNKQASRSAHQRRRFDDDAQISSPEVAEVRPSSDVFVAQSEIRPNLDMTVEPQSEIRSNPDVIVAPSELSLSPGMTIEPQLIKPNPVVPIISQSETRPNPDVTVEPLSEIKSDSDVIVAPSEIRPNPDLAVESQFDSRPDPDLAVESESELRPNPDVTIESQSEFRPNPDIIVESQPEIRTNLDVAVESQSEIQPNPDVTAVSHSNISHNLDLPTGIQSEFKPNPDVPIENQYELSEEMTVHILEKSADSSALKSMRLPTEDIEENRDSGTVTAAAMETISSLSGENQDSHDMLSGSIARVKDFRESPSGDSIFNVRTPFLMAESAETVPGAISDGFIKQNQNVDVISSLSGEAEARVAVDIQKSVLISGSPEGNENVRVDNSFENEENKRDSVSYNVDSSAVFHLSSEQSDVKSKTNEMEVPDENDNKDGIHEIPGLGKSDGEDYMVDYRKEYVKEHEFEVMQSTGDNTNKNPLSGKSDDDVDKRETISTAPVVLEDPALSGEVDVREVDSLVGEYVAEPKNDDSPDQSAGDDKFFQSHAVHEDDMDYNQESSVRSLSGDNAEEDEVLPDQHENMPVLTEDLVNSDLGKFDGEDGMVDYSKEYVKEHEYEVSQSTGDDANMIPISGKSYDDVDNRETISTAPVDLEDPALSCEVDVCEVDSLVGEHVAEPKNDDSPDQSAGDDKFFQSHVIHEHDIEYNQESNVKSLSDINAKEDEDSTDQHENMPVLTEILVKSDLSTSKGGPQNLARSGNDDAEITCDARGEFLLDINKDAFISDGLDYTSKFTYTKNYSGHEKKITGVQSKERESVSPDSHHESSDKEEQQVAIVDRELDSGKFIEDDSNLGEDVENQTGEESIDDYSAKEVITFTEENRNTSTYVDWGDYGLQVDDYQETVSANESDDMLSESEKAIQSLKNVDEDSKNVADERSNQEEDLLNGNANADTREDIFNWPDSSLKSLFTPDTSRIRHLKHSQDDAGSSLKTLFATPATTQISHLKDEADAVSFVVSVDRCNEDIGRKGTPTHEFNNQLEIETSEDSKRENKMYGDANLNEYSPKYFEHNSGSSGMSAKNKFEGDKQADKFEQYDLLSGAEGTSHDLKDYTTQSGEFEKKEETQLQGSESDDYGPGFDKGM